VTGSAIRRGAGWSDGTRSHSEASGCRTYIGRGARCAVVSNSLRLSAYSSSRAGLGQVCEARHVHPPAPWRPRSQTGATSRRMQRQDTGGLSCAISGLRASCSACAAARPLPGPDCAPAALAPRAGGRRRPGGGAAALAGAPPGSATAAPRSRAAPGAAPSAPRERRAGAGRKRRAWAPRRRAARGGRAGGALGGRGGGAPVGGAALGAGGAAPGRRAGASAALHRALTEAARADGAEHVAAAAVTTLAPVTTRFTPSYTKGKSRSLSRGRPPVRRPSRRLRLCRRSCWLERPAAEP